MSSSPTCPDCGQELPPGSPRNLCPGCLLNIGLGGDSGRSSRAGSSAETAVLGPRVGGVLSTIAQTIGPVPRVLLRDTAPGEPPGPIIRPDGEGTDRTIRFRIDGEIARGGMGSVLKGRDPDLGREVALKVLRDDFRDDAAMIRRFVEEAQIGGQLQHPGVVPIYELGTFADRRPFFSMKLVKGHTQAALLAQRPDPGVELPRHLSIFESIAQTVAYAHARGVIHRDLKPSNVMVGSFGEVQVMDWGLAKVLPQGGVVDDATAGRTREETVIATARSGGEEGAELSHAGSIMGTPSYMAPEQARGEGDRVDERADVFALGSILCEILTGQPAFVGRSAGEIQRKAGLGDTADALARLDALGADPDLIALARHCLARERVDRPRDASAVAGRITAYLAGVQERVRLAERERAVAVARAIEERRRRKVQLALAASVLGFLTLGGLSAGYYLQQRAARVAAGERVVDRVMTLRGQALEHPEDLLRWQVALAAAEQAEPAGDPEPLGQLRALQAEIRDGLDAARRDRVLLDRLVDIRSASAGDTVFMTIGPMTDDAYADAFREAGYDVVGADPKRIGARLAARPDPVRRGVAAALDHWSVVRKGLGTKGDPWPKLVAIARAVDPDPDPDRDALRAALGVEDKAKRLELVRPLAERADPGTWSPATLNLLSSTLSKAGDKDAAVRVLRRAAGTYPTDVWIYFNLGTLLRTSTPPRTAEAIEAYSAARALRPEVGHYLAHLLSGCGRIEEAEAILRYMTARRPSEPAHLHCLAAELESQGRHAEAAPIIERDIAASREAIRNRPDDAHGYHDLGRALYSKGDLDGAIAASREAIRIKPDMVLAHANLGNSLDRKGDLDGAIAAYRESIPIDPDYRYAAVYIASMHYNLGNALASRGDLDGAMANLSEAIRLKPDFAQARNNMAVILGRKGGCRRGLRPPARGDPDRSRTRRGPLLPRRHAEKAGEVRRGARVLSSRP